jgi:hypothetical protein
VKTVPIHKLIFGIILTLAGPSAPSAIAAAILITTPDSPLPYVRGSAVESRYGFGNQQTDTMEPYEARAFIGSVDGTAGSASFMNRSTDGITFGASGELSAWGSVRPSSSAVHAYAYAFDAWDFTLDGPAEFFFTGVLSHAPVPFYETYAFVLRASEGAADIVTITSQNAAPLSAAVQLEPGSYRFTANVNESSPFNSENGITWSYRAGIPEPGSALLSVSAAVIVFTRRKRS